MSTPISRRTFHQQLAAGAAAAALSPSILIANDKPAILGGTPVCAGEWPRWPVTLQDDIDAVADVLKSGDWYRYNSSESTVDVFERQWAAALNVPFCQATSCGTSALITALAALNIGPGDEVLLPPYTFIATVNAVILHHALPVFVDSDPATAQIDPAKIEERVNENTRCVIPVHIGGASCDIEQVLDIAKRKKLAVVEDSCQTHTGEWKGKRLGTFGDAGCYSFQNSKNLTSGEGGAMVTSDETIYHRAQSYQDNGGGRPKHDGGYTGNGANLRLTNFQGALLQHQLTRLEEQSKIREENAAYLRKQLDEIGGVRGKKLLAGTTRHGYHLFIFEYAPEAFAGMNKRKFTAALQAEGVPATGGYSATNKMDWAKRLTASRHYRRIYGDTRLKKWQEENVLPANDRMIKTTCWFGQNVLLAERERIDQLAEAFHKVKQHAAEIAKA